MGSDKCEIKLKGEASFSLPAERAVLSIDVTSTEYDKQTSSKNAVSAAKKIESLLRQLGPQRSTAEARANAAVDVWSRTSLSERSHTRYDHEKQKHLDREYTAEVNFDVHFQHFQAIGGLIHDLSALPEVETNPLEWILLEKTKEEHRSALRTQAAKNAYQKALEYAKALDYQTVVPFELKEATIYAQSSSRKMGRIPTDGVESSKKNLAETTADDWEEVGGSVYEYQPEDIKMSVAVDASFYAK